jgi:hypothetical protein
MSKPDPYRDWMKKELGELIEQLHLDELQKRYLRSRWLDQVLWMEAKAGQTQLRYTALRLVAIIGGVIVPVLVGLNLTARMNEIVRGVTVFLSLAVAISVAVEEFFHYGERWRHYRATVELLKREGWQLFQLSGRYAQHASHADAYRQFAEQVEQIIQGNVSKFITEVVSERKQGKDAAKPAE